MSGLCGILTLDRSRPDPADLEAITKPLRQRGPDGTNVWFGETAAFGHSLLATTPESLTENLPVHHADSGCTITADVRLDNREELAAKLRIPGHVFGDGELILLSYLKWGERCVDHFLGDFAFAIWDERERRLFCARDQVGMRQFAYCHLPGRAFVFATEPAAVLRHSAVPSDLNNGRIADFLDNLEHFDLSATFYSAVKRLPPAHTLIVDPDALRIYKYWCLQSQPVMKLRSNEEYVEAFGDIFRKAVRCRLRSAGSVGSMLSGGIDSGSVTAIAAELLQEDGQGPLPTFSAIGPDPECCPETRAILASAKMPGIEAHFVSYAQFAPFHDELIRLTKDAAEPFDGEMVLLRALYLAAHRAGFKVVLDGVAGDVVFYSDSWAARLIRRGRIIQAWREVRGESHFWGPTRMLVASAAARGLVPRQIRRYRRQVAWWWNDLHIGRSSLISRAFAARSRLRHRRLQFRHDNSEFDRLDEDERVRRTENATLIVGRERYDRVASSVGIEARDPFMDIRVMEFCLSLPWEQLQSEGWPKVLMRRAAAGRLPDVVRWRQGKEHLGKFFNVGIFQPSVAAAASSDDFAETIAPYVNLGRLRGKPTPAHCNEWIKALCLYHWLKSKDSERTRS